MSEMEKRRRGVGLVISAGLIIILTLSNIIFFVYIQNLQRQLQSANRQTGAFQSEKNDLLYEIQQKSQTIQNLQHEIANLERELDTLRDSLKLYEQVPHGYYNTHKYNDQSNTIRALENFLAYDFKLPASYKEGDFDCSESSACLEWALEDAGFNAWIVVGPSPWGEGGYHAWVIVYTKEYTVAIEATALTGGLISRLTYLLLGDALGVIYSGDQYGDGYYHGYDTRYKNIYQAIKDYRGVGEWDWWRRYWWSFTK